MLRFVTAVRDEKTSISSASDKNQPSTEIGLHQQLEKKKKGVAYISQRWDLCVSCGLCEVACSMFHHEVINRELSRVRVYRYFTPLPKGFPVICCQCRREERECEKACPIKPPVIHYDEEDHHMKVDIDRCLGKKCGRCRQACPAQIPRFYPPLANYSIVCDLCEKDGERKPQCVIVCPTGALEFKSPEFPQHMERIHPNERAEIIAKKFYPLAKDTPGHW